MRADIPRCCRHRLQLLLACSHADMSAPDSCPCCMCCHAHPQTLQQERDHLVKEKSSLVQKLHKAAEASAEERRRLEAIYKDKLTSVERRVKELGDKEKEARRGARQLVRLGGGLGP